MKHRPIAVIAIGLLIVIIAFIVANNLHNRHSDEATLLGIHNMIRELEAQKTGPPRLVARHRVLYAAEDIQVNQWIRPGMIVIVDTPDDILQETFTSDDLPTVETSLAIRPIRRGDPLNEGNVGIEPAHMSGRVPVPRTFYEKTVDFIRRYITK